MERHRYSSTSLRKTSDHDQLETAGRTEDQGCSLMGSTGSSSSKTALKGSRRASQDCGWDVKDLPSTAQLNPATFTAGFTIEFGASATQANTGVPPASASSPPESILSVDSPVRSPSLSPPVGVPEDAGQQGKHAEADIRTFPLKNSPLGVKGTRSDSVINGQQISGGECLFYGANMGTENRNVEFKRGGGDYLRNTFRAHLRRYACAFLNSGGGSLLAGVDDDGVVRGLRCDHRQEDRARLLADATLKGFHPPLLPNNYSFDFLPVVRPGPEGRDLKVLRLSLRPPPGLTALYQTDQGEVFLRRDGSVEGPLSARAIQEWGRQRWSVEVNRLQQHVEVLLSQHRLMLQEIQQQRQTIANLQSSQAQTTKAQAHTQTKAQAQTTKAQAQTQTQPRSQAHAQTQTQTQTPEKTQTDAQTQTKRQRSRKASMCRCM